ncbi:unnamed protein product [Mytilus edulis]|uniref:Uncharacterized protein n=1 Tax=Mytilus edulis TaxID=6550 RepID=A0A8S3UPW8_MYTED|nr:unnamed protein product [Mytilus edulis]
MPCGIVFVRSTWKTPAIILCIQMGRRRQRESKIENIICQKQKITAQVCLLKKQVIQHVEKLEEEFIKELDQIESDCCDPIHSVVSSLQDKAKEINKLKSEIKNTKKYASNLQTFLNMREIQAKSTENEKYLQTCIENEDHESINIESKIDTKIQDFQTVESLGFIKVKNIPSTRIGLIRRKDRQAQIIVSKAINSINDVKLELIRKFNTTCTHPSGCCVINKGKFLFSNSGKLIIVNADEEVEYTIPLKLHSAFDVACIDDSTVAVSTGFFSNNRGIRVVDLIKKNYSITKIPNTALQWNSYVSWHADKIVFTNPDKNKVTCCEYRGTLVWEFKDPVLDRPLGIAVDNNRNVFVVGNSSCNVVVISPDGKQCKQILTKEDGLEMPTAICCVKKGINC